MRILVTGGRGFVGSHLVERLCKKYDVEVLDKAIGKSIDDYKQVSKSMMDKDLVIHLAGHSGAVGSKEKIYDYFRVNSFGTLNVLNAMIEHGVKHIIFTSSFSTYGTPKKLPVTENTPINPNNVYGHSKSIAEQLIKSYKEEYGITATIFRINMIYGEHQTEMNAIQGFVDSALKGEPLIIFGDGKHTREYVYVGDVVDCIESCIEKRPDDTFIVSTEKPYSINKLADIVANKIPKTTVKNIPKTKFNFNSRTDCTKIHKKLGWGFKTDLPDGIDKVINWRKSLSLNQV